MPKRGSTQRLSTSHIAISRRTPKNSFMVSPSSTQTNKCSRQLLRYTIVDQRGLRVTGILPYPEMLYTRGEEKGIPISQIAGKSQPDHWAGHRQAGTVKAVKIVAAHDLGRVINMWTTERQSPRLQDLQHPGLPAGDGADHGRVG